MVVCKFRSVRFCVKCTLHAIVNVRYKSLFFQTSFIRDFFQTSLNTDEATIEHLFFQTFRLTKFFDKNKQARFRFCLARSRLSRLKISIFGWKKGKIYHSISRTVLAVRWSPDPTILNLVVARLTLVLSCWIAVGLGTSTTRGDSGEIRGSRETIFFDRGALNTLIKTSNKW